MVRCLERWVRVHPEMDGLLPEKSVKEALARQCGVTVRSVEYWFWALNKTKAKLVSMERA